MPKKQTAMFGLYSAIFVLAMMAVVLASAAVLAWALWRFWQAGGYMPPPGQFVGAPSETFRQFGEQFGTRGISAIIAMVVASLGWGFLNWSSGDDPAAERRLVLSHAVMLMAGGFALWLAWNDPIALVWVIAFPYGVWAVTKIWEAAKIKAVNATVKTQASGIKLKFNFRLPQRKKAEPDPTSKDHYQPTPLGSWTQQGDDEPYTSGSPFAGASSGL